MASSEFKPDGHQSPFKPSPGQWLWYLAIVLVVGAVEPLVSSVRQGSEPIVGHWFAYALGIVAAGAAALPMFASANWVIQHERSKQTKGIATMIYRPAALPVFVLIASMLKDFPKAFTEIALYGTLGGFIVLLAIAVKAQQRKGHAWSWSFAILIGFGMALLAALAGGVLSLAFGQRP